MTFLEPIFSRYGVRENPLYSERRLELIAIFFGAGLCGQLIFELWRIWNGPSIDPIFPAADILKVATKIDAPDLSTEMLRELIERPLFWEARKRSAIDLKPKPDSPKVVVNPKPKPPTEEKIPESASLKKMKQVSVLGIFGGGNSGGAILNVAGKEVRLLVGQSLADGWTLSKMEPNRLVFKNGSAQDDRYLRRINPLLCKMDPNICAGRDAYGRKWVRKLTLGGIEE